jgi:Cu2+-exporting ATPase
MTTATATALAATAATACGHCGLPVPTGRIRDDAAGASYCCAGCELVAGALREHGLDRFYDLREQAAPARTTSRSYEEFDDPAFQRLHVERTAAGARAALYLEDLRCTACLWLIESTPRCVPGVSEVRVDLGRGRADVVYDPATTALSTVARHLDRLGHPVHPYRGLDRDRQRRKEDRALLIKLGVAGAALGNLMLLAVALYCGLFGGMSAGDTAFFRWASMIVALPALGFAATPFFRTALGALRAHRLHLDLPLSIGILAGLGWGGANVIRGVGEIYFDTLAMLIFLLLVSRWVVLRHQRRASSAAELLLALTSSRARRLDPDSEVAREVPIEAIVIGDRVRVLVGETIPVDGVIAAGRSTLDVGLLTGESRPVEVTVGGVVHAGTINVAAPLVVRTTAVGEATRVGALVASIEALASRKAPIERLVDRVAGTFVVAIMTIAVLTATLWSIFASAGEGFEHAMALLIVTCPCALALATPLAVTVALGRAARRGVLIKGADALERLAHPGTLFIDKTGTLTAGTIAVTSWHGDDDARALAAALETASNHPIARALARGAPDGLAPTDVEEQLGRGLRGVVQGHRVIVGATAWVRAQLSAEAVADGGGPWVDGWVATIADRGETPVAIAVDGALVAVAGLADPIRPEAAGALARLAAAGWRVELLSGDDVRVARRVGTTLGLAEDRCHGGVSPEGKRAAVVERRLTGPVVMVGDGVNDAAAMVAATCGIAVSGSAEVAVEAADVYLRHPGIDGVAAITDGARATMATIRRNLRFSLFYNSLAGVLAVTGVIHPLIAAAVMPLSSLTVLASSLRSAAFRR